MWNPWVVLQSRCHPLLKNQRRKVYLQVSVGTWRNLWWSSRENYESWCVTQFTVKHEESRKKLTSSIPLVTDDLAASALVSKGPQNSDNRATKSNKWCDHYKKKGATQMMNFGKFMVSLLTSKEKAKITIVGDLLQPQITNKNLMTNSTRRTLIFSGNCLTSTARMANWLLPVTWLSKVMQSIH